MDSTGDNRPKPKLDINDILNHFIERNEQRQTEECDDDPFLNQTTGGGNDGSDIMGPPADDTMNNLNTSGLSTPNASTCDDSTEDQTPSGTGLFFKIMLQ